MTKTRIANGVEQAYFARWPGFASRKRATGRRAQGIRYEKLVQAHLTEAEPCYLDSPWLRFLDADGWHWCQPDGIHFDFSRGIITIVEVKYQHTPDAWVQLLELYGPVLQCIFPASLWTFRYLEWVRWHDPAVRVAANPRLIAHPFGQNYERGVHIWK